MVPGLFVNPEKNVALNVKDIRTWRWLAGILQAGVILGLPFVRIRGESALRFDIPSLRLHVFGHTIWIQELFIVLVATLFVVLLIIFMTLVFGRVWCGWLCPQTVIVDFTPFVDRSEKAGMLRHSLGLLLMFLISIVVAASLIWYFVSPYEFIDDLLAGRLGMTTWGFWAVFTIILFLDFAFLRHRWCKTICPYSMLQGVLFDKSTMIIELEAARSGECIDCGRCVKVCPTHLDIRNGADSACINCAGCIDACNHVMTRQQKKGLIRYAFGSGNEGKILRQSSLLIGSLVTLLLAFLIYLMAARTGVEVTVLPHTMEARQTREQLIINAYQLAVINMLDVPVDLDVTVDAAGAVLVPAGKQTFHIDSGDKNKFPLFVKIRRTPGMKTVKLRIRLFDQQKNINIVKEANFVIPHEL